jgi:uncharacterized membrane protein YkoI
MLPVPFKISVGYIVLMKSVYVIAGLILMCVNGGSVVAQEHRAAAAASKAVGPGALKTPRKRSGVSVRRAIALAREETGGRVLSSKSFNGGTQGAQIYQIRLLVEGERVITVVVDAKGRVRRR